MALHACVERQTDRILDYLHSLTPLGREMNSSAQVGEMLASTLSAMEDAFDLQRTVLLVAQESDGLLLPVAARGLAIESVPTIEVPPRLRHSLISKPHLRAFHSLPRDLAGRLAIRGNGAWAAERSALIPLATGGELVGLFLFEQSSEWPPLDQRSGDLLTSMCQNLAVYLYNQIVLTRLTLKHREIEELCGRVKEIYRQAIMAFLTAIDIKDGYTKEHSLRVAEMTSVLAREIGFSEHEIEGIYFAGLLHDIGKILVDKHILTKPASLDLTEYAEMNDHTRMGAEILSHIQFPWDNLVHAILHHHDRPAYDEFSPPRRYRHLDLGTKIIGLVDAFDAMTSDRPYRRARTLSECFGQLLDGLGSQFDPEVTRIFLKTLDRDFDRAPLQRRLLSERLLHTNPAPVRRALQATLDQVEQFMGVVTTY
jgi:putative nucleotidyltransferase with HDIG domain